VLSQDLALERIALLRSSDSIPRTRRGSSWPSSRWREVAAAPPLASLNLLGQPSHHPLVAALPTGTVTFLFTDVEGSTRLLQQLGDAYAGALAEHRRVLREAFATHSGVEVDTQGDAFFVAFAKASDALAAATEARDGLRSGPIRVRMGVHTGRPLLADEGYVGIDVHRAARIMSAGHGGQVLPQTASSFPGSDLRPARERTSGRTH
jgi:class 3 adenylate cyclase